MVAVHETLEADDLLGSYARLEADAGGTALVMTGDRDMFQCADERVTVLYVRTGGRGAEPVGPADVQKRYGVAPELVPDFIALRGDPSDGIPGARESARRRPQSCSAATARWMPRSTGGARVEAQRAPRPARAARGAAALPRDRHAAGGRRRAAAGPPDGSRAAAAAARERGMNRLADRLEKASG